VEEKIMATIPKNQNPETQTSKPSQTEKNEGRAMMRTEPRPPLTRGRWPLSRLRSEFDRLFDDFFRGGPMLGAWPEEPESRWGLDVRDEDDKVVIRAEAPGFEPQDFNLQVHDNQLELCACQSAESEQAGERHWHQQELYRSIPLPSGVDEEHVDAQYHNGVLTITVPKTEQSKRRRIEVKS
jgi:HSP20 family protein